MSDLQQLIPGEVFAREDWGGTASPGGSRRDRSQVIGLTGHHTTGNTLGEDNQAQWVLNIYNYHTGTLGWADIGYAYLYDRYGNVYVGRGRYRQLAHATGYNTTWLGVAFLGDSSQVWTDEAAAAFIGLRTWLRNEGGMVNMDQVNRHRDIGSTACPGSAKASWIANGLPAPDISVGRKEKDKEYQMVIYAHRDTPDSLSAYNVLSQHNAFAVFTHSRGEAREALDRGETVVAVGGPAADDLGDEAVKIVGSDRSETLVSFSEWAQDNL